MEENQDQNQDQIPLTPPSVNELQRTVAEQAYEKQVHRKAEKAGRQTSLVFALIASSFLAYQCYSYDRRGEPIPVMVWFPSLCLIGAGLGVSVDASAIGRIFVRE